MDKEKEFLLMVYNKLLNHFGYQNWWPGDTKWEIIVGAILTQNVSWKNVAQAIENLKEKELLNLEGIYKAPVELIAKLIVPTRYYNLKAKKLKTVAKHIMDNYSGDLENFLNKPMLELRQELLNIWGIGPETADSILLYAGEKPSFVVDAYTKRIFQRLGIFQSDITYEQMRNYFMEILPQDVELYNDYHAQIVALGNNICKNKPLCKDCPLNDLKKCPDIGGKKI